MGHWADEQGNYSAEPWLDDFRCIPESMHDEFAAALVQGGKRAEVNLGAMLLTRRYSERFKRQYLEYLAGLKSRGVQLSLGSDCHGACYEVDLEEAERRLGRVGIRDQDLWRLPPRSGGAPGSGGTGGR
jgi:hypothetical protein